MRVPRRWRWLVVTASLAAAAGGGWFVLFEEPDHPLGWRNYRRIAAGMTRDEVAQILGGPPGVIGQEPEQPSYMALVEQEGIVDERGSLQGKPEIWYSNRGQIAVLFDSWEKSARVVGKQLGRPVSRS